MKTKYILFATLALILIPLLNFGQELSPKEIIRTADEKFNGEKTSISLMAMTSVRPTW
jgi:hypothetical protein